MNKKYRNPVFIAIALVIGLVVGSYYGPLFASDKLPSYYGCNQIARWHADILMRDYGIHDGFNTSPENPKAEFNQRASDINLMILNLCFLHPDHLDPAIKPMIEEMLSKQYSEESTSD